MSCNLVRRRLVALTDNELSASERDFVLDHLGRCESCMERHLELEAATPVAPRIVLDPATRHALHLCIEHALDSAGPAPERPRRTMPAGALVVAAAAVLFVLGWGVAAWTSSPGPVASMEAPTAGISPAVPLDAYRPAAYTPEDGWF